MSKDRYIECGKIINTHGCKGGVKAESWCNFPEDLASLEKVFLKVQGAFKEYKVKKSSVFKQFVLFDLEGIIDMDMAVALKGQVIYADKNDFQLDDGEFFIADVIGLDVIDINTKIKYGTVSDIINRGASDIYVVKTENGEAMIPAVEEFIKEVDIENNTVLICPIDGMFE